MRALPRDSIGSAWVTVPNFSSGAPLTRWVGESGVTSSGLASSSSRSSRSRSSYSVSEISGSSCS